MAVLCDRCTSPSSLLCSFFPSNSPSVWMARHRGGGGQAPPNLTKPGALGGGGEQIRRMDRQSRGRLTQRSATVICTTPLP